MAREIAVSAASTTRTTAWVTCATFVALAAALRLYDLSAYGLETDEVFSVTAARAAWNQMFAIIVNDKSHPPLHYILLKLSLGLDAKPEIGARLPSVLFGVGLVPVAWALCRDLALKYRDALLVLLLTATNGALIYFAQYARMFAALEFFAALSLLLFVRLWREFSWRTWALLTVVNILMVYSHYWGAVAVATQCILIVLGGRKTAAMMSLSAAITGLAFLPWVLLVGWAAQHQGNLAGQISWMGTRVPGLIDYLWLIAAFNGFIAFPYATRLGLLLFAAPVLAACLPFAIKRRYREFLEPDSPGFWIVLIVTPMVLTSLGSFVAKQNLWGERHLSMVALPYYVLIGLSLGRVKPDRLAHILRGAIVIWTIGAAATYLARDDKRYHWEILAETIATRTPAPVYVSELFVQWPLAYYLKDTPEIPVTEERELGNIRETRFWYVYRDVTWTGADPATQFISQGYTIGSRLTMPWWRQTVVALLIEKRP